MGNSFSTLSQAIKERVIQERDNERKYTYRERKTDVDL